jgi:cytochrome oxidase Cu insertion factor (SCO1/SenC/PrrC family)
MTVRQKISLPILLILATLGIGVVLGNLRTSGAEPALRPPEGLASTAQPTPIPEFSLAALHNTTIRSADLQGKVTVIRFWATW